MGLDLSEKGRPTIDQALCSGCGACVRACHSSMFEQCHGKTRATAGSWPGCIACGSCMMVCPAGAVTVRGRRFDAAGLVDLPATEPATADQLEALLLARRSARRFERREVDRALVDRILEMTATAPMGIPPSGVGIVVFHGREKVHQFAADIAQACRVTARSMSPLKLALLRPLLGRVQTTMLRGFVVPLLRLIAERWDEGQDAFAYDAPLAFLFHTLPEDDGADVHIVATYAMLAAESLGLGTCLLGTAGVLDHCKLPLKERYGIPATNKTGLAMIAGYADQPPYRRGIRRPFAAVRFA